MSHVLSILGGFESSIGKLLLATILGGIIGWERERRGRPAGLRTHILVCVGVTLMMVVSENMFYKYKTFASDSVIRIDPARIAAQVVTGIGFLGAGTIMRFKASVRGLTTAASLWVVAGIGLAIGSNCYIPAMLTTVIVLFSLLLVPYFEKDISRDRYQTLKLCIAGSQSCMEMILEILKRNSMEMQNYGFERDLVKDEILYDINVKFKDSVSVSKVSEDFIRSIKEIRKLGWE
ncbi:MAG: MgtC/SapB family protein [Candidatus Kuenenia sp.]|nr:MgtC/SapB family protein [Candidatus Kuenenia hertensis]